MTEKSYIMLMLQSIKQNRPPKLTCTHLSNTGMLFEHKSLFTWRLRINLMYSFCCTFSGLKSALGFITKTSTFNTPSNSLSKSIYALCLITAINHFYVLLTHRTPCSESELVWSVDPSGINPFITNVFITWVWYPLLCTSSITFNRIV